MTQGIYCYIDKKNNQIIYVGKDSNIHKNQRHKDHFKKSQYNIQPINRILQNNPNRYKYKVLEKGNISPKILEGLEQCFIKKHNTFEDKNKFNYTSGGDSGKKSKETKEKMSRAKKGKKRKPFSNEWKKNISKGLKGKKHSQETKEKISKKAKKRYFDNPKNNPMYGKHHSLKSLLKMSNSRNKSGYFRVSYKQNLWQYRYSVNGKRKVISNKDIKKLEQKVKEKKLPWIKFN